MKYGVAYFISLSLLAGAGGSLSVALRNWSAFSVQDKETCFFMSAITAIASLIIFHRYKVTSKISVDIANQTMKKALVRYPVIISLLFAALFITSEAYMTLVFTSLFSKIMH